MRVLPADSFQFGGLKLGVTLQSQQCIRCLDRPMLPRVAREDDPAFPGIHHADEFNHLPCADLPGFVHQHHTPFRHLRAVQKIGYGRWLGQTALLQVNHLLTLRGQHRDGTAVGLQFIGQFFENKTFARARAAAKQGDEISGGQQPGQGISLFFRKCFGELWQLGQ